MSLLYHIQKGRELSQKIKKFRMQDTMRARPKGCVCFQKEWIWL